MYLITVFSLGGSEVAQFTEPEPLDFNQERAILEDYPDGYYVDIQRIPSNPFSDSECWRDYEVEV